MNAKELAEAMLSGELGYKPDSDTAFIAEEYLKLIKKYESVEKGVKAIGYQMDDFVE